MIDPLKVTEKLFDLLKPKSSLSRLEEIARMQLSQRIIYHFIRFRQKLLSSYFPTNFSIEIQKFNETGNKWIDTFLSCTPEIYYKHFFCKHFLRILLKHFLKTLLISHYME